MVLSFKHNVWKRIMAFVICIAMISGSFPQNVMAAGTDVEGTANVVVKDEDGNPVSGAKVSYTVSTDAGTGREGTTDDNGVFPINFISGGEDVSITATISKDNFKDAELNETVQAGSETDLFVNMEHIGVWGVKVEPAEVEYNGNEFDAAKVTGIREGDKVSYCLNEGEWTDNMPKIKDVGKYQLQVLVERAGYNELHVSVQPEVKKGRFTVGVEGVSANYNDGEEIELVKINESDLKEGDVITYTLDGKDSTEVPKRSRVGEYEIRVKVERSNYYEYSTTCTAKILPVGIQGLSARLYEGTYDENPHDAVIDVMGTEDGDIIEYSLNGGDWTREIPQITNADDYTVDIRVSRGNNYQPTIITELSPKHAVIEKAEQSIAFTKEHVPSVNFDENNPDNNVYDFSAQGGSLENPLITYSIMDADNAEDISDAASIDENGKLTIVEGGISVKVIATVKGNENYNDASVSYVMTVVTKAATFKFNDLEKEYTVGTSKVVSNQKVTNIKKRDSRTTEYKVAAIYGANSLEDAGLVQNNEVISVSDFSKLVNALSASNNKSLTVVVNASRKKSNKFPEATIAYQITIKFGETPSRNILIRDPNGNILTEPNGPAYSSERWYNTYVEVELEPIQAGDGTTPVDTTEYKISKRITRGYDALNNYFLDKVRFGADEQGADKSKRLLYFRNTKTGAISAPFTVDAIERLDITKPDNSKIVIEYDTKPESIVEQLYYYFNGMTSITFKGYDDFSGIHHFTWNYKKEEGAVGQNLVEQYENSEVQVGKIKQVWDDSIKDYIKEYSATIVLPKDTVDQLRGHLEVTATDMAGLTSNIKTDDGRVIVVDTIAPTRTVNFALENEGGNHQEVGGVHYFSDNVKFEIKVDETNFRSNLVKVTVEKDGESKTQKLNWTKSSDSSVNSAALTLSEEGVFYVHIEGKDPSGHQMENYTSPKIIIDKTKPEISFSYSNGNKEHASIDNEQSATITVVERNFRASDIQLVTSAVDIKGNEIAPLYDFEGYLQQESSWTTDGDKHTATIASEFADAIYEMEFDYKDLCLNPADHVKTGRFIVDHKEPSVEDMGVIYSTPLTETILEAITLGFYNPTVDVTFVAKDLISGVGKVSWEYNRQEDVSETNVEKYETEDIYWKPDEDAEDYTDNGLRVEQDSSDPSRFTATVRLPKEEAEQLRGNIAFTAMDRYSNTSNKLTDDGTVIVVDTIAPEMTVEYTEASNTKGEKLYYNKDFTLTLDVNEANFFMEDVAFEVSKNGGEFKKATVTWEDKSPDQHIGTYKILAAKDHSGDGDYVIRVNYKDRSNNEMETYTSKTIVVDTIKPAISVEYSSSKPVNTLKDNENHKRKYYSTTQKAVIKINEHNFDADKVTFDILAKDVSGKKIKDNCRKTKWSHSGDTHTLTITYPGDANYTFDMECEDLATNKSSDYKPDYFTVDKTAPTNLSVNYSTSILETVLSGISFGFYNSKVTVTIRATDNISAINKFDYSYVKAPGVSSVNAELLNQLLSEAQISYSNGGATGTARFEIPKSALGGNNQFNGNVKFNAINRSGKKSNDLNDTKRIVVDNISPTSTVEFNAPVNVVNGISYYDGAINATITINEANFYPDDVNVSVTKDGGAYSVSPSWSDSSADVHVGSFSLSEDGDYFITVSYTDKSSNQMATYTSEQLTVDTQIEEPIITINGEDGNGKAYKDKVVPTVSFEDQNFDNCIVKLTRTRYDKKDEDVTDEFITPYLSINDKGGAGTFDSFKKEPIVDGIYTLSVSMTDKANHASEKTIMFTVNRFGSVYEFNDYLVSLINNGGEFVYKVEEDLVITEYNADRLLEGSLKVEISRDGKPLDDVAFMVTPEINDNVRIGESGWYQYRYTISKENFNADGIYKVSVSSKDATGNSPETTNFEDRNILFRVDSTPPEISSISGLEKNIINAQNVDVKFNVYDSIGLAKITVFVDDNEVLTITDFSGDSNNYQGLFSLLENSKAQSVRIVAEDLAGNITDTSTEGFVAECAYAFNPEVIVSTNPFVRAMAWVRAHALAVGVSTAALLGALFFIILMWRRRKEEEEEGAAAE